MSSEINRISSRSSSSKKSLVKSSLSKKRKKGTRLTLKSKRNPNSQRKYNLQPLTIHNKICAELYGVTYEHAKSDGDMLAIYYNPKKDEHGKIMKDEDGNIMYPKQLDKIGTPIDSSLTRRPWTGKAKINSYGISANVTLYE